MSSLSIIDKGHNHSHLRHFVVQTRTFQIEKARNVDMYGTLRVYIKRQNEKRKQEMEMSEELKRARREKELKHKRDKLTLDEVKEEICKDETKLNQLQNEKHQLFTEFKKVLNEDENRKNIERAKEAAMSNITFGPPTTTPSSNHKPYQAHLSDAPSRASSGTIMPSSSHANSTIMPSSLHHLQPIQSMFFPQGHSATSTQSMSQSNAPSISSQANINHHRMSGRGPTPTTTYSASSKPPPPPPLGSSYASKPMPPHLSGQLSVSSASMIPSSAQSTYPTERHRLSSYKRAHDQVSSVNSVGGVITVPGSISAAPPPSHMHYMPSYKPPLGQPSMPLPPGAFAQLGGQHVIPNLEQLQLQNLPLYQTLFSSYNNPMSYMGNPNSK